ncbi:PepSY-associated TM helix domain-containing protein [Sphingomonas japonica]|uniref:Iron-regulated membrane protein n=1 Tax=Sphingomonas japonica TaxID=511662 RepID=A0ABX0U5F1_9SPHN|nr:PepSY domain-containing protein [Sphingomonas japonica]NIJ24611.1 putative iron-regulated membrane protein [Sphingomonas japonica]
MVLTIDRAAFHRTIWRWHFYAGLFVIPFVLLLAVTGSFYLFKPQVERWEERAFQGLPTTASVGPRAQVDAALAAFPGARFASYRLPERSGDAALVHVALPDGAGMRDVFVAPQGRVLGNIAPDDRLMEIDKRIHGELLLGKRGSWLVELAASWAIVLVLTGLYLWWPRGRGLAGVVWPRLRGGRRVFWRDLHAVTGFWISGLVLVLLVTGLPWAGVWGSAFKAARGELGWVQGPQDWTLGGAAPVAAAADLHASHDHAAMVAGVSSAAAPQAAGIGIDAVVARAAAERLAFPVIVTPPGGPGRFGKPGAPVWTVRSDAQNRPLRSTITYDPATGREISREGFADGHLADRVVGYGIAWHEGALFGWVNQLIGVLTAIGLATMAVSGFVLWRRRKPPGSLGAPPAAALPARMGGVAAILIALAALLPLLALSLAGLWLFERLLLPRLPGLARWLSQAAPGAA